MTNRTFDRIAVFDEKSRAFPVRAVVASNIFESKEWPCDTWNDQGSEGACVGFGWSHELSAEPSVVPTNYSVAFALYKRAQQLDQWAGEDYEGTSVLAGAKAVRELKNNVGESYISEYRWAFGLADLLLALAHQGPVVLGLNWYEGMFDTDWYGYIRVRGGVMGGHCLLATGVYISSLVAEPTSLSQIDLDKSYIILHNSWGRAWGQNGKAKITLRDMQRLLSEQGDACVPMVRHIDHVIVPTEPEPETPEVNNPVDEIVVVYTPVFVGPRSKVFHDEHKGIAPVLRFDDYHQAVDAGYRPCKTCKPSA